MDASLKRYLRISFFNLSLVAAIGVVLRYKIAFSLPFVDQKHLLHGHSHFAFAGWITQTLMVLMIHWLSQHSGHDEWMRYKWILATNLLAAYGMLLSFPVQGYGAVSILFSTFSVFVSYVFAYRYWKDLDQLKEQTVVHYWFKAGLLLGVVSSIGTFGLAFMMANKIIHQNWYLAAVYFYLHFQYNGWFFFASMGLLYSLLPVEVISGHAFKNVFICFAFAAVPAYFLSTLWLPLPLWLFVIVVVASFVQLFAWLLLLSSLFRYKEILKKKMNLPAKWLLALSGCALTIKLSLQLGSTIPSLSQLAFGFRPIVVAYLHLVLLGVITLFLLGYVFAATRLPVRKLTLYGVTIFTAGIFLNEAVLMIQGVASFSYTVIPYTNELLLGIALLMFTGITFVVLSQFRDE